jgi:hypothetical protein
VVAGVGFEPTTSGPEPQSGSTRESQPGCSCSKLTGVGYKRRGRAPGPGLWFLNWLRGPATHRTRSSSHFELDCLVPRPSSTSPNIQPVPQSNGFGSPSPLQSQVKIRPMMPDEPTSEIAIAHVMARLRDRLGVSQLADSRKHYLAEAEKSIK